MIVRPGIGEASTFEKPSEEVDILAFDGLTGMSDSALLDENGRGLPVIEVFSCLGALEIR